MYSQGSQSLALGLALSAAPALAAEGSLLPNDPKPGFIQQLLCLCGIVLVGVARRVGPGFLRQNRMRDLSLAQEQGVDHALAIDCIRDGLSHFYVIQRRFSGVKG